MTAKPERAKESERQSRSARARERSIRVFVCADSPVELAGLEAVVRSEHSFALAGHSLGHESLDDQLFAAGADVLLERVQNSISPEPIPDGPLDILEPNSMIPDSSRTSINVPRVMLVDEEQFGELASAVLGGETSIRAVLPAWASEAEILAAVHAAATGLLVLHPETAGYAADHLDTARPAQITGRPANQSDAIRGQTLSPRETEILNLLAAGLANKEIAFRLGISEHTVKFHVTSIFTKLDVTTRAAAVAFGIRRGLISL